MRGLAAAALSLLLAGGPAAAQDGQAAGLAAWARIKAVVLHPRCTNCHVGPDGVPMWQGLGYGDHAPHGMNIRAGDSRIGAETVPCRTCHFSAAPTNDVPHAAPHLDDAWRLPPVALAWLGKPGAAICAQLRDPARNDGRTLAELVAHFETSAFVRWSFAPGAGRDSPPGTLGGLLADVRKWTAAGAPCANDP